MKKISSITIGLIALLVLSLVASYYWNKETPEKHWSDKYDMDKELRIFGETATIRERIEVETAKIKEDWPGVCLFGKEMFKEMTPERTDDEVEFLEIIEHLCQEYR